MLNKFKDYVDKCLAMIDVNCKKVESAISLFVCVYKCVCVWVGAHVHKRASVILMSAFKR